MGMVGYVKGMVGMFVCGGYVMGMVGLIWVWWVEFQRTLLEQLCSGLTLGISNKSRGS
jgi:hypothetical protein